MSIYIEKYKGIHPGIILEREFKKRALLQNPLALSIGISLQTLNAIIKGKRKLNIALALKIEEKLDLEEGTLALLQTYFDIKEEKSKLRQNTPNLLILRKSLFWDTEINNIDWSKKYRAVIQRIFERGNESEKDKIINFYGAEKVNKTLSTTTRKPYTLNKEK